MLMFKSVPRTVFTMIFLCVAFCSVQFCPVFGQDAGAHPKKLQALLEERRDVLKQRAEAMEALFKIARCSYDEVYAAREDMLNAEYELAADKPERIKVLQKKLSSAKAYEELMQERKKAAQGSQAEVLLATAHRLEVEIELLREEQ